MSETMLRHWKTLQLVPRHPRKATAKAICDQLANHGYRTTERTVQRDLSELSASFAITCDDRSKPYGWRWAEHAELLNIPSMDLSTALTFRFVREYVDPLLPSSVRSDLTAHFDAAAKVLDTCTQANIPGWAEKIVVIPQGQKLHAPSVDSLIADRVFEALLTSCKLELRYRARSGDGNTKEYAAHPLGLVLRNQVYYLVATLNDYPDAVQLALHRIEHAEITDEPAMRPDGFSLRAYVAEGKFDYPVGDAIKLRVLFDKTTAYHLTESPISNDQVIEPVDARWVRITATVQDTQQLRWWLLAFGDQVVVEAPAALRNEFRQIVHSLSERYA